MFKDILILSARLRGAARTSVRGAGIECDRHQWQRCALKKTKQRVPAPRRRATIASAAGRTHRGWNLSPLTSEKPDNSARRGRDPGDVGRIGKPRFAEGMFLYLVSVALVAAATIVLFSVASISLLDTSKETLTRSRLDNRPIEDKFIGTVVSSTDSNAAPVPVQTKSPSSSEADILPSSTPVPLPSGMPREETVAEPALNLPPNGEASTAAVETPHGSTRGPSTDETPPPELSGSQEVIAQPLSTADEASTAAVETPHGSARGPSADETPAPGLGESQEVIAQPLSTADEASAAQHALGVTMPTLATSDEQRDQMLQDFEIQGNHNANLDEGSVAFTPEIRFPEKTQVKESTGFYGSGAASPGSHPPLRHAASRRPGAVQADRDNIAKKLNRAELSGLLKGERALSRAPLR
jgi:hypothetical protein